LSAPATASAPKMMKSASCMMFRDFFRESVVTSESFRSEQKDLRYLLIVKHLAKVFPAVLAAQSND
jgi:hypothetical protein